MTYDPTTDAGKVRLLCTDTDTVNEIFSDVEITAFLDINGDSVLLAAAQALDTIAASEVLVQKRIKLLDLSTDGPSEAAALSNIAKALRAQATGELLPDWAENPVDVFSLREKVIKDELRGLL
jgi:hypothetical protein